MLEERHYPCNRKLAERLGISFITLKRWIYQGKIRAVKTIGRRYRIPESEILRIMGKPPQPKNRAILYARVSGRDQVKDGDLDRQLEHLRGYAMQRGYTVVEEVREVASGLNDKRPKLTRILKVLAEGGADIILAEYRDRLTRFGFNYLSFFAQSHGARIETVFDDVKKDAMQELIEDMISVVQSFSARLYGRRSHKYKRIVEGVKAAAYSAG
jgi:putative resolvase